MRPGDYTSALESIAKASGQSPLVVLETFLERAAIREYEGGYSRAEAERLAIGDTANSLGLLHPASQHPSPTPELA